MRRDVCLLAGRMAVEPKFCSHARRKELSKDTSSPRPPAVKPDTMRANVFFSHSSFALVLLLCPIFDTLGPGCVDSN